MEEAAQTSTASPKPNPFKSVTPLSKALALVLFIALPFIGFYFGWSLKNNLSLIYSECANSNFLLNPVSTIQTQTANTFVTTGKIQILSITDKTMEVQFIAESTKGDVTQMMVWTDTNTTKAWKQYTALLTLPISDDVYVKYRDSFGNESQIYSDTTFSPQGPPAPVQ